MSLSDTASYFWILVPLVAYCLAVAGLMVSQKRIPLVHMLRVPLHLLALGLALFTARFYLPVPWAQNLEAYGDAVLIFAVAVLAVRAIEAAVVGYLLTRLRGRGVPGILRQFMLLVVYFTMALVIMRAYLKFDVTSLVATSAVVSFVLGLASQDLLGSILASIVIGMEGPMARDQWVEIDGHEGRVVDITWRRTRLETRDGDFVLVPNAVVMKDTIFNYTMPDPRHRTRIKVGAHYRHPPNQVKAAMLRAAAQCPEVLSNPPASVFLEEFGDSAITYRLNAWITSYGSLERVKDEIRTHIWYEFDREGIEIPFPIRTLYKPPVPADPEAERDERVKRLVPILSGTELFAGLPAEALADLAGRARVLTHGAGEVLFRENDPGGSFYLLLSGRANVIKSLDSGAQQRLGGIEPGQCFGEMSLLLGEPRSAMVQVETDSELVEIDAPVFKAFVEAQPAVLEHLSALMENRRADNEQLKALFAKQPGASQESRVSLMMRHIKKALGM